MAKQKNNWRRVGVGVLTLASVATLAACGSKSASRILMERLIGLFQQKSIH